MMLGVDIIELAKPASISYCENEQGLLIKMTFEGRVYQKQLSYYTIGSMASTALVLDRIINIINEGKRMLLENK